MKTIKNKLIFFTLYTICAFTCFVNAQSYIFRFHEIEVDYSLQLKVNKKKLLSKIPAQFRKQVKQDIAHGILLDCILKSDGEITKFILNSKLDNDNNSLNMVISNLEELNKEPLYKIYSENIYLIKYNKTDKSYLIKNDLIDYKWKITKQETTISGLSAYKAIGILPNSKKVEAWFSKDIKVMEGPDKFYGLPGLILKASFYTKGIKMIYTFKNFKILMPTTPLLEDINDEKAEMKSEEIDEE